MWTSVKPHWMIYLRFILLWLRTQHDIYSFSKILSVYYTAAAKLLQSCPTLCEPIDGSPQGPPVPRILQARKLEWVAISFSNAWKWKVKVKSLSHVWLLATPWTAAHQAPPSMGFSRQGYWSRVPLPSPVDYRYHAVRGSLEFNHLAKLELYTHLLSNSHLPLLLVTGNYIPFCDSMDWFYWVSNELKIYAFHCE